MSEKSLLKVQNKQQMIEANKDDLGKLLAISAKNDTAIGFEEAVKFPLHSLPLCLAFPNGTRRTTAKSKIMEVILSCCNASTDPKDCDLPERATSTYLVDLMALVRTMPRLFDTYHDLAMRLFDMLPVGYNRIDIVA